MQHVRRSTEDYLKTIYILQKQEEVHACRVAELLGCSKPTVSVALKRLVKEGYLVIDVNNIITLTQKGSEIAKPIYDRNQIIKDFLMRIGVSEAEAVHDACELEHGLGEESYAALSSFCHTQEGGPDEDQ